MKNDLESIVQWFNSPVPGAISEPEVVVSFHASHPRTLFLKSLPAGATMLDVGAGQGSLQIFRSWPPPARSDLKLFAYSLDKGIHFDAYDGYEIGDWNAGPPKFEGIEFDAIFSAHFIEHIKDPRSYFAWAASRLGVGGRIYTEWPSELARHTPTKGELFEQGIDLFLGNFYDDLTHRTYPSMEEVLAIAHEVGLEVEATGTIRLPVFETELLGEYRQTQDKPTLQMAYWLRTGWCQYLILHKPSREGPVQRAFPLRRSLLGRMWSGIRRLLRRAMRGHRPEDDQGF